MSKFNNALAKARSSAVLISQEESSKTSNVGRRHGGSGDGKSLAVVPGGEDIDTGGIDINSGADVGEIGAGVVDVASADGAGSGLAGGGVVFGVVTVAVTGRDGEEDTGGDGGGDLGVG